MYRAFKVRMPSGVCYWTVIGDDYIVESIADRYLRELRFGKDRAESTTKAYAESVSLFLKWCSRSNRQWRSAAVDLTSFMLWLQYTHADGRRVLFGPGSTPARSPGRINKILVATRGFLSFAVLAGDAAPGTLAHIYELADSRDLPAAALGESSALRVRLKARHSLREPETAVDRASDAELLALFKACLSARDRLIVLLLARGGLRRGELVGVRRSDLHLLPDNTSLECRVRGAHLHVVRRANPNGAMAKSHRPRSVPLDFLTVRALDLYVFERAENPEAADCDLLLVNLFRAPVGAPMKLGAINELFRSLSRRGQLSRNISPHQCRHAFASNLADSGALADEIQGLLGHRFATSADPYVHPSRDRLRSAVERVNVPRELVEGLS